MSRPARREGTRHGQRGFTLIELMVVMTILGLMGAAVAVYMRPQRSAMDCANLTADLVRETARKAFARGPVRADVVNALGFSYRTKLNRQGDELVLQELVEDPLPGVANWVEVQRIRVITADAQSSFTGWKSAAQVNDGTSANAPAIVADFAAFEIKCWPDGHCDAGTVYFAGANGSTARTIIMPLGGAVLARRGL